MMVSTEALIGVVEGRTSWGDSGEEAGRLLVWRWNFDDIDEIYVGRTKKMFKMWDTELVIKSRDPKATLQYDAFGEDVKIFNAYDSQAKAAKQGGSHLLGFANILSEAIARHRSCRVNRATDGTKETEDVFTFA
jgi:hypothetical protein